MSFFRTNTELFNKLNILNNNLDTLTNSLDGGLNTLNTILNEYTMKHIKLMNQIGQIQLVIIL
jgi:hypothetical protein